MPINMKRLTTTILCLAAALCCLAAGPGAEKAKPLAVPQQASLIFEAGKTNYTFTYSITNNSDKSVQIAGYTASCECTQVEATDSVVPPLGQVKVRAHINRAEPTVQFVILQDGGTNLYQTLLFVLPNK